MLRTISYQLAAISYQLRAISYQLTALSLVARVAAAQIPGVPPAPNPFNKAGSTATDFPSVVCRDYATLAGASGFFTAEHKYEFTGSCLLARVNQTTKTNVLGQSSTTHPGMTVVAKVQILASVKWSAQSHELQEGIKVLTAPYAGTSVTLLSCPQDPMLGGVKCTGIQHQNTTTWEGFDFFWDLKQPVLAGIVSSQQFAQMSAQSGSGGGNKPPPPPDPKPAIDPTVLGTITVNQPVIELEATLPTAQKSEGQIGRQDMAQFVSPNVRAGATTWGGGAQLLWAPGQSGAQLNIRPNVIAAGRYHVFLTYTKAPDYATVRISLDGRPAVEYDGYAATVSSARLDLGILGLNAGQHDLLIVVTGKNPASSNFLVGLDRLELVKM